MESKEDFLNSLEPDRRGAIEAIRKVIVENLKPGFEETFGGSMIHFVVSRTILPEGYHCNPKQPLGLMAIANTKTAVALHCMGIYGNPEMRDWFKDEYAKTGFKVDMGEGCIRFKKLDQIPYELIGRLVAKFDCQEYVDRYRAALATHKAKR